MKSLSKTLSRITVLLLITNGYLLSQENGHWNTFYVTGYNVNVREAPDLEARVLYSVDWGAKFHAKRYDDSWFQVLSWDEVDIHFIHGDYLEELSQFVKKVKRLPVRNSLSELSLIDHFITEQDYVSAVNHAIKLIEKKPEETILTGFERCELVSYSAYQKIADINNTSIVKELKKAANGGKLTNSLILNLIELAEIEELIRDRKYDLADRMLRKILEDKSEYLSIEVGCEYDYYLKTHPEVWLKKLFFINYHLMPERAKNEVREYLFGVSKNWEDSRRKEIALDIKMKLNVFSER